MFLDIIAPKETLFPRETFPVPSEEAVDVAGKVPFFQQYQTTLIVAGLLILAIIIVIVTKAVMKKEIKNA